MEELKTRLQKYRDLQAKKHEKFLEAKQKVYKYQKDSYRLLWKIEKAKELLMTTRQSLELLLKKTNKFVGDL